MQEIAGVEQQICVVAHNLAQEQAAHHILQEQHNALQQVMRRLWVIITLIVACQPGWLHRLSNEPLEACAVFVLCGAHPADVPCADMRSFVLSACTYPSTHSKLTNWSGQLLC